MNKIGPNSKEKDRSISNIVKTRLISISQERYEDFLFRNPQIHIDKFLPGIREEELSKNEIDEIAISSLASLAREMPGSIGNAHSIFWILKECISEDIHQLILEDDTQIHPHINEFIINSWETVKNFDVLLLGGNTDAPISFEALNGMTLSGVFLKQEDRHPSYERIEKIFSRNSIQDVSTYKLKNIFGSHAWIVSPQGAKKLIENCFPLDMQPIKIPLLNNNLLGISFDRRWNSILGKIDAGVCLPFLALTPNNSKTPRNTIN